MEEAYLHSIRTQILLKMEHYIIKGSKIAMFPQIQFVISFAKTTS
jgi:hypothetical protein